MSSKEFDPVAYINEPRWMESRLGLERIAELLELLGSPQQKLKFVHVAGTNGKGSTCKMLATVLQEASYKVGLFTSPYIIEFADRIQIDGCNIPCADLRSVTLEVKQAADAMKDHPTEFELMTAVAFLYFAQQCCDIVVCEVGLGGRLDSTNVIKHPELVVITQIALDHTDILGDTLEAIAAEKAGIIKSGAPVVSWPQEPEALRVVEEKVHEEKTTVRFPDFSQLHVEEPAPTLMRKFSYKTYDDLLLKLQGNYQPYNAALVVEIVEVLNRQGWGIGEAALRAGFEKVQWPGRFELVSQEPTFIIDGAHNAQGVRALAQSIKEYFPGQKIVFIMGVLKDKEYPFMIGEVLPFARAFITVTPPNPRALPAEELAKTIREVIFGQLSSPGSLSVQAAEDFPGALSRAETLAGKEGIICAFGSLYSVAELKRLMHH